MRDDHVARLTDDIERHRLTAEGEFVTGWFWELHAARGYSGFGAPEPLRYVEIEAWARLTRIKITVWALRLLRLVDGIYMRAAAERIRAESERR